MSLATRCTLGLLAAVISLGVVGCKSSSAGNSATAMPVEKPLWDRLGGEAGVTKVVDAFVDRAAKDPKVNFTREGTSQHWDPTPENVAKLKKHLVQFIASATGGPQTPGLKYEDADMKTVHTGMQITNAQFNAAATDLALALGEFNVPDAEQEQLLTIVASTRGDIVEMTK